MAFSPRYLSTSDLSAPLAWHCLAWFARALRSIDPHGIALSGIASLGTALVGASASLRICSIDLLQQRLARRWLAWRHPAGRRLASYHNGLAQPRLLIRHRLAGHRFCFTRRRLEGVLSLDMALFVIALASRGIASSGGALCWASTCLASL